MNDFQSLISNSPSLKGLLSPEKRVSFLAHVEQLSPEKKEKVRQILEHEKMTYPKLKKQLVEVQQHYLQTLARVTTEYKFDIIHRAEGRLRSEEQSVLQDLMRELEYIFSSK